MLQRYPLLSDSWLCFTNSVKPSDFWFWLYCDHNNCTFQHIVPLLSDLGLILTHRIILKKLYMTLSKGSDTYDAQQWKKITVFFQSKGCSSTGGNPTSRGRLHWLTRKSLGISSNWRFYDATGLAYSIPHNRAPSKSLHEICSILEWNLKSVFTFFIAFFWVWVGSTTTLAMGCLSAFVKGPAYPLCHTNNNASRDCSCPSSTGSNYMEALYWEISHQLKEKLNINLKLIMYLSGFQNTANQKNSKYWF